MIAVIYIFNNFSLVLTQLVIIRSNNGRNQATKVVSKEKKSGRRPLMLLNCSGMPNDKHLVNTRPCTSGHACDFRAFEANLFSHESIKLTSHALFRWVKRLIVQLQKFGSESRERFDG